MKNVIFTHADNNNKYYQSKTTNVTEEGRLQSAKLFSTKVSIDYAFDFESRGLTASDILKLVRVVSTHLKSDSTLKCYDPVNRRQVPMKKTDLQKVLDLKKDAFKKFFARCTKANIFKVNKWISNHDVTYEAIFMNPAVMQLNYSITPLAYWLFKSDIDKKLDDTTIAMFTDAYYSQYGIHTHKEATEYLSEDDDTINHLSVFNELVLNNKKADIYHFGDTINTFFLVNESRKAGKRRASDITTYRNLFIDIDAGKDEEGNYFTLEEVAARKEAMLEVIYSLPLVPTVITDTRNGYHCIWAINPINNGELWQAAEDMLVRTIKIADTAVSDKARVLRMPGTTWKKGDYDEYEVTIFDSNNVRYDIDDFVHELSESKDDIESACNDYLTMYPMTIKAVQNHKTKDISKINNQRIKAIRQKSVFLVNDTINGMKLTSSTFKNLVKRYNLADFLGVPDHGLFNCIFHDDTNDSANIIGDEKEGYRYYCFNPDCAGNGDSHGSDIINCVMMLQDCNFREAISYLAKVFNVRLIKG